MLISAPVTAAGEITAAAARPVAAKEPGRYLVEFAPGVDVPREVLALESKGIGVSHKFGKVLRGAAIKATERQAEALARSERVAAVEIDARVNISETQQPAPWGLDRLDQQNLPLSGSYTTFSSSQSGVRAYVVDTGILASHSDFGGRVTSGWTALNDGRGTTDCNGHGTHVAATVGGQIHGVAKSAVLVPVRVLDCNGSGYYSDVIAGLDWVATDHRDGSPAVVNLSLGGPTSKMLDVAVQNVINDGVAAVVAAGNSAIDACNSSPARLPAALSVAASDSSDRQASFSNYGVCVDLYAPGVGISSAWHTSTTATASASGTSMAAPHVAGAAVLLLAQDPLLTPAQVSETIVSAAVTGVIARSGANTPNRLLHLRPAKASAPVTASPFTDVAPDHAFYKEITWLAGNGISNGWTEPDGTKTYRPTLAVSREAMAAFMYRLAGSPAYVPSAPSPFTDIATNHVFYKEIAWLAGNGISNGWTEPDGTKTYRPTLAVSREAMAAFMYRLAGSPAYVPSATSPFTDIATNHVFYKEITWLAGNGISNGWTEPDGTKTYRPTLAVSREAMAAFMYRLSAASLIGDQPPA
ncbi:S8 family serine peptidase [Arthrobacter sp. S13_S34]|nr:S8 family serine peptidase [Arthrobacter sp. S13_S34]